MINIKELFSSHYGNALKDIKEEKDKVLFHFFFKITGVVFVSGAIFSGMFFSQEHPLMIDIILRTMNGAVATLLFILLFGLATPLHKSLFKMIPRYRKLDHQEILATKDALDALTQMQTQYEIVAVLQQLHEKVSAIPEMNSNKERLENTIHSLMHAFSAKDYESALTIMRENAEHWLYMETRYNSYISQQQNTLEFEKQLVEYSASQNVGIVGLYQRTVNSSAVPKKIWHK